MQWNKMSPALLVLVRGLWITPPSAPETTSEKNKLQQYLSLQRGLNHTLASLAVAARRGLRPLPSDPLSRHSDPIYEPVHSNHKPSEMVVECGWTTCSYRLQQEVALIQDDAREPEEKAVVERASGITVKTVHTTYPKSLWFAERPPETTVTVTDSDSNEMLRLSKFEWSKGGSQCAFEIKGIDSLMGFQASRVTGQYDEERGWFPTIKICADEFRISVPFNSTDSIHAESDKAIFHLDHEGRVTEATLAQVLVKQAESPSDLPQTASLTGEKGGNIWLQPIMECRGFTRAALLLPELIKSFAEHLLATPFAQQPHPDDAREQRYLKYTLPPKLKTPWGTEEPYTLLPEEKSLAIVWASKSGVKKYVDSFKHPTATMKVEWPESPTPPAELRA